MKRYMICPIIGDGSSQSPYRAAVSDVAGVNTSSIIPTHASGPNLGHPKYGFAFCIVAAINWTPVRQITNSYLFPDYALDSRMDAMEGDTRTGLEQSVEAFDMDGEGLRLDAGHNATDSYRHVVDAIAKQIEPAFNIDIFSTPEVAVVPA